MPKQLKFNEEARSSLLRGVNIMADTGSAPFNATRQSPRSTPSISSSRTRSVHSA